MSLPEEALSFTEPITVEGNLLLSPMELWEQERQHAEQERQRAGQERQRADHAEQLLEEYQRRFGKLE